LLFSLVQRQFLAGRWPLQGKVPDPDLRPKIEVLGYPKRDMGKTSGNCHGYRQKRLAK